MSKRYKVVQWATGNVGLQSLRSVIEHPDYDLVGLWVHSADKEGRDAGALCGLPPTGIKATRTHADIVALEADCVLYMPQRTDLDEVTALLRSGKNIVTTRADFHHPRTMEPEMRRRLEEACAAGGVSLYATGSSPGFATEALLLPLLAQQRRLDCLTIDEFADLSSRNSPDMLFNVMGFGAARGPVDPGRVAHIKHSFGTSLGQIADAIGAPFDSIRASGEVSGARARATIAAGIVEKGTAAAYRLTVEGMRGAKPIMRFRANWYCTRDIDNADWDLRGSGWRIRVEGDTPLDVGITFPVAPEHYAAFTPGLTAHRAVNAVPAVCAAPPGLRSTVDLPHVIARL